MVSKEQLSALLIEWTKSVIELDIDKANELVEKEPELLWTPIPESLDDIDHLQQQLVELNKLGTSFQPLSAIHYTCLYFYPLYKREQQVYKFLLYLIEQSSIHDLDTRFWGECNNSTLHLICFLGYEKIIEALIEKGVSATPSNDLGYLPKDVAYNTQHLLKSKRAQSTRDVSRTKSVRPNYSTPDRFKLLRDLAEESSVVGTSEKSSVATVDRKKSEGHYFKKGRVKETQQKVLTEEEVVELEKRKRQLEVAQLVKKSAVKNNPLFKKMEKRPAVAPSPSTSSNLLEDSTLVEEPIPATEEAVQQEPKRNSKVISSLKTKSYVSTSIFVQADEENPVILPPPIITTDSSTNHQDLTMFDSHPNVTQPQQHGKETQDSIYGNEASDYYTITVQENGQLNLLHQSSTEEELDEEDYFLSSSSSSSLNHTVESLDVGKNTAVTRHETSDEEEVDYSDDDDDDEQKSVVQIATRLVSPVYSSVLILNEESAAKNEPEFEPKIHQGHFFSFDEIPKQQENNSSSFSKSMNDISKIVTESPPMRPQRSDLRKSSITPSTEELTEETKERKRTSGSQKAAWTMSMSSWAAILDREFNLDEIDQDNKLKQHRQSEAEKDEKKKEEEIKEPATAAPIGHSSATTVDYLSGKLELDDPFHIASSTSVMSLSSTLKMKENVITPPPRRSSTVYSKTAKAETLPELPRLYSSKSISRKPITTFSANMYPPPTPNTKHYNTATKVIHQQQRRMTQHGKLYLHVNGIQDILLPLPKERAYVRCVVSDGRFEYMSRYEILSQNINFDYECVIDTHPDMIITISLHVRPDYVMKSRKPFSRLFSSKKKKESLSGYVNKEDGAIGQARFALAHMLPACTETIYLAGFHCFNAWYSRSFKERHRQKKKSDPDQDVLKVVGNFDVEMLYIFLNDFQKPFPRNLRECDMAIKQLHRSMAEQSSSSSNTEKYHTF